MLLVDAALANRALDPVLPRLLLRDPDKLLDRMTLLLSEPSWQRDAGGHGPLAAHHRASRC